MRINQIQPVMYANKSMAKSRVLRTSEPITGQENNATFQGVKGGAKGGLIGAAAALTVSAIAGPFGLAILPLWTVCGAIAGHASEEGDDSETDNKKQP